MNFGLEKQKELFRRKAMSYLDKIMKDFSIAIKIRIIKIIVNEPKSNKKVME